MSRNMQRGAISELIACAWLLEHGYEVYRNVAFFGKVDIVAFKDGEYHAFDVKTATPLKYRIKLKSAQLRRGVKPLYVLADGSVEFEIALVPLAEKACGRCRKSFQPKVGHQLFCSVKCRLAKQNSAHYQARRRAPKVVSP